MLDRSIVHRDGVWTVVTYLFPPTPAAVDAVRRDRRDVRRRRAALGAARREPRDGRALHARSSPRGSGRIAIVLVLLIAAFRRWDFTLLALVPTVLALTWTGGVLAVFGISLDLFSMFAVMTFVGIGVDYGIHLVHRWRTDRSPSAPTPWPTSVQ